MDNTTLINEMLESVDELFKGIDKLKAAQNDDSDYANPALIEEAEHGLIRFQGALDNIVP